MARQLQRLLQADAYGGYDGIYARQNVTEVACWAHARRKFFDAKETDGRRSAQMLEFVRQLYAIEDEARSTSSGQAKTLDHDARRDLRQQKSRPLLAQIKTWLDAEQPIVLPRSPMGQAITYTLNQWTALTRYTDEGFLNIDNNAAERALKRVAIGRKNWLFAGHDQAGASHARLYSLIASAQRHGLDPQKYLMSVLAKIGQIKLSEIDQFLPEKWKAEDAGPHVPAPSGLSKP
ncbi:MAG: IS66 family transposase [Phycisphaerales bacterium]|nr:IS66 family transposase [Phycisphaerales bacterium]